jgi:hypothetical protein
MADIDPGFEQQIFDLAANESGERTSSITVRRITSGELLG